MQIRILAGTKRLMMALAIASLIIAPAGAAEPVSKGTAAGGVPLTSGNVGQQVDDGSSAPDPILYARSNYSWPFSSGPVYGSVDAESWGSAAMLHTAVGSFDLTRGLPDFPTELRVANKLAQSASQYFLMQVRPEAFVDGTFDELKRTIVAQGGSIVGEMPVTAFIVRMTPGAHTAVKDSASILGLLPYQPAFKLSPEIGRVPLLNAAKAVSNIYSLKVQLFPGESVQAVAALLTTMGLQVRTLYSDTIVVDADRRKLAAIAAIDSVFRIEEVLPIFLMSEETSTTIQGGKWNNGATPYTDAGVDGGGLDKASQSDDQILAILDNGIQLDAGDLSNTSTDAGEVGGLPIANHRKVAFYGTTAPFGGTGDLLGCDNGTTGGVTHGHTVAAVALGNATKVPGTYGTPYHGTDTSGNFWGLDGVAPKARLVAYDGQVTPLTGRCDDVQQIEGNFPLDVGDLSTLLADAYSTPKNARIVNFSWGSVAPGIYDTNAGKIDAFLSANSDAAVFVSAGNTGTDKNTDRIPDQNTIGAPATAKNVIVVGASRNADDLGDANRPNQRATVSSNGPATAGAFGRIAPLLMAPGNDTGSLGLVSEFHCRSNDNNQTGPVECDVLAGQSSTSFASAAAAGAGLLIRDYFAQGFYPDGTNSNTGNAGDKVPTISGSLIKAILVTSAEWMHIANSNLPTAPNLTRKFRGNREQGFGRIVLSNALPLNSYSGAVSGLIVGDGGGTGQAGTPVNSTGWDLSSPYPSSQTYTLNVCDTSQPLHIAIAWNDPSVDADIDRDLDLEVTAPSGRKYLGNFFTDDVDDTATIVGTEECTYISQPWPPDSAAGVVDTGPWSLPVSTTGPGTVACTAGVHVDYKNNVEAVFLSPDSRLNGIANDPDTGLDEASDNQVEQGAWTVVVKNGSHVPLLPQPDSFSIAITGGVCLGSSARVQRVLPGNQLESSVLTCNDSVKVTINEVTTGTDPISDATAFRSNIAARTVIQVVDANNVVTDTETQATAKWTVVSSVGGNVRYDSDKILLTDGTAPESGNGALDVRDGQTVRVTYTDANPTAVRVGTAEVGCRPVLSAGGVRFQQFGKDAFTFVDGGCENDNRFGAGSGYFTFGFPDRYMDEGELVSYIVAFKSAEIATDLVNVSVSLKAVKADTDSPKDCKPGTTTCADPNRTNNICASSAPATATTPAITCPTAFMTILDSPKIYGVLPAGATLTPSFTIQMNPSMPAAIQTVDMIIGVIAKSAGKGVEALIAQRESLNADATSLYYSTDFPTGGTESVGGFDINNNEILETTTTSPRNFTNDYFFETRSYSNMTATNPLATLQAPWNFDTNNGGFVNGLQNTSRPAAGTYAQWGEDKNYNGALDGYCTGNTRIPCTQGDAASEGCRRCSGNNASPCLQNSDCSSQGEGTCLAAFGTCNYSLDEDRNPINSQLDTAWSTAGGCGWQTKAPLPATTGGVWHTGLIGTAGVGTCLAADATQQCQLFSKTIDGDSLGDNNWWELLVTPVLHKVNTAVDGAGDPLYQVAITDWAWNMSVDIPDTNASVTLEFDTDTQKSAGVDLYNDGNILLQFRGKQGAISSGNAPITNGFNMFARISNCQDTDGNGSLDRCGTAAGRLCGANKKKPDTECGPGLPINATRGLCSNPSVIKRCTGNRNLVCSTDADCNQRCANNLSRACQGTVFRFCSLLLTKACTVNANCTTGQGTCTVGSADCTATATPGAPAIGCGAVASCNYSDDGVCADQTATLGVLAPGEKCVSDPVACTQNSDCGAGTCIFNSGPNRQGQDNCEFQGIRSSGAGNEYVKALEPYGLAQPNDDDAANGYCVRSDGLTSDTSTSCSSVYHCEQQGNPYATIRNCSSLPGKVCSRNSDCTAGQGTCTTVVFAANCSKPNSGIDEYVTANGPGRNYGIQITNGPDMRFTTLEDIYGDTGSSFQAALGFNNREPTLNTLGQDAGFGVAVDDMVISWKETKLDVDATNCTGSGECATLESSSGVSYEGNSVVSLTVTDKSPYGAIPNDKNDCNGDGDYTDVGVDDQDCNNNGLTDVTVKLTSDAETAGEIAFLDKQPYGPVYKANFPYSTLYNSPGTLFVVQSGTAAPIVLAEYVDRNDGTGSFCKNNLEPTQRGSIIAQTEISSTSGRITVNSYSVKRVSQCTGLATQQCVVDADCTGVGTCSTAFGDDDGFPDTNELNNLVVVFANKSGVDVDDLTATLGTTDTDKIDCITRSAIVVGALADKALSNPATYLPFQFKVKNINRTALDQVLQATFTVTVRSNRFDALTRATEITLDLDKNATGTIDPANSLFEDFEVGFGKFTLDYLDKGLNTLQASDGWRCAYNDPFGLNSNNTGRAGCFLGFAADPASGVNDWHIHTSAAAQGVGRAFTGKQSLHLGVHSSSTAAEDTTRLRHIMAISTINKINVGLAGGNPELNFAMQVSFVDNSSGVNVSVGEAVQTGVVETKETGGIWKKLKPYENVYDEQGTDDFSNCMFDPIDDGNNEDSFKNPEDPNRRIGFSSTCFPEFNFTRQGQTDYRKDFDATDIGLASDGPGLQGCSTATSALCLPPNIGSVINNPGTWVRPKFSLVPLAGQSVYLRFLYTAIELADTETMFTFFGRPNVVGDDGWYIDDIHIDGALNSAISLSVDQTVIAAPIACSPCSAITPLIAPSPASLSAPGQIVTLSAGESYADRCLNGVLQYQFWNDLNGNGNTDIANGVGDAGDVLFRDWTDSPTFVDAPIQTTNYGVKVRCSTSPSCDSASNSKMVQVPVTCPTAVFFPQVITLTKVSGPSATINWASAASVDAVRGSLVGTPLLPATFNLRSHFSFQNTVNLCLATNSAPLTSVADTGDPGPGNGFYYLVRGQGTQRYSTGAASERGQTALCNSLRPRDSEVTSDPITCP